MEVDAARGASTDAFHLAMLIAAALCAAGAVVNGVGIRNPSTRASTEESRVGEATTLG